jgi:hypothetical protein
MNKLLGKLLISGVLLLASAPAFAGPASSYPNATTPYAGTESVLGSEPGPGDTTVIFPLNKVGIYALSLLSGDCTLNGSNKIVCTETNGSSFGTFATANTATPPAIGTTTPNSGAFTTLSASGALSGAAFSNYFASPPAIGSTAPNAGSFSSLNVSGQATLSSLASAATQCLQISAAGAISGAGGPCSSVGSVVTSFDARTGNVTLQSSDLTVPLATPPAIGAATPNSGSFTTLNATSAAISGGVSVGGAISPSTTNGIAGTTAGDNANTGSVGEYLSATFSGVTMSSQINLTSISLTAGDWDVEGSAVYSLSTGNLGNCTAGITTVSNSFGPAGTYNQIWSGGSTSTINTIADTTPLVRINVTSTTTVYFTGSCAVSNGTGSPIAVGNMRARRIR